MAILPEELPVVLTLFLGLGAWRLAREKVLARSIPAVELLGATTVLCVDKTGTLTANRMAVRRLWSEGGRLRHRCRPAPRRCRKRCTRCSSSPCWPATAAPSTRWSRPSARPGSACWPAPSICTPTGRLVDDYPLSREMLAMSRVWQSPDRRERLIAAKGAPEAIVDLCHLDAAQRAAIAAQVAAMAGDGLRVLGVARASFDADRRCPATSTTSTSSSSVWSRWRIRCGPTCRRPSPSAARPASAW